MFRFKYLSVILVAAMMAGIFVVSCNDKDEKPDPRAEARAEGVEAGKAMCDCVASYAAPNPADPKYVENPGQLNADFNAYYMQLYECLGLIHQYEKYARLKEQGEEAQTDDPLLNVFMFHDDDFKEGFLEGVSSCYDSFNALWALMPQ